MSKIIEIKITKNNIRLGQQKLGQVTTSCAIARALQRHFHDRSANWAYVHGHSNGLRYETMAPVSVRKWVERHDDRKTVKSFIIRIIQKTI